MSLGLGPLVYIMIFVAIVVMVQGIYMLAFGKSISMNSRLSRRMALLEKTQDREKVLEQLRKEMNQHIKMRGFPLYAMLAKKAQLAAIAFTPNQLIMIMGAATVVAFVGMSVGTAIILPAKIFLSVALGFSGVYFWVHNLAKKRMKKLEEQLPDAIELIVRSLRVGHPLISAIGMAAREVADPLGTEFGVIADEAAYGRNVADALNHFAERMDNQDLRFLAIAVNIQQTSGGNLAEILDGLSKVIRGRFKLFRRVHAITSEARFTGNFLAAMPILVLVGNLILRPGYYDPVMESSYFVPAASFVAIMLAINMMFMKIIINFKV